MEFKEGDLVKVKNDWWDRKVVNRFWIVGKLDWFGKVYLIDLKSRERYLNNQDFNDWANSFFIKKTQVLPKYLEKANWDELKTKGGVKMPRIFKFAIYLIIVLTFWKVYVNIEEITTFFVHILAR